METTPMAGKTWQPSHESPHRRKKAKGPVTLIKQCGKKMVRETGEGDKTPCLMLEESTDSIKLIDSLVAQEHVESWHMCRSKCH